MTMKTISFILPVGILEDLDMLVRNEIYSDRSKIMRIAIRDLLKGPKPSLQSLDDIRKKYYQKTGRRTTDRTSLKIPAELKKALEKLVKKGIYPSKSEAVRVAILIFIKRE
ncbi:MAG: ribbon-helix-helix domain-containing protein [Candidatus Wukongarchaeota archaeon]|nr:ribbon-helix-helix domain-containing protein [Candidatus Wukongarchaeota archaeon]